jgi:hypothetical protein
MADPSERPDKSDRRRLQQIQQTDLTESRLNDDFLYWLKNKGPNYLFVILLILCGIMGWNLWQRKKMETRTTAWADFSAATLPVALEEVAASHKGVDAVGALALLSAADRYLNAVQSGTRFDRQVSDTDYMLTPELREQWLAEADRLYGQVLTTVNTSGGEKEKDGFIIAAHFGRAAIAESRGELEVAKSQLTAAATAAETHWQPLAAVARRRIDTLGTIAVVTLLPARAEVPAPAAPSSTVAPVVDEQLIRDLLTPSTPSTAAPSTPSAPPVARPVAPPAVAPVTPPATPPTTPPPARP